jgi:hypothetical protein
MRATALSALALLLVTAGGAGAAEGALQKTSPLTLPGGGW